MLIKQTKNSFVQNTISVWCTVHKYTGEPIVLSQFTPIWGNGHYKPGKSDRGIKLWAEKGIRTVSDLYFEGSFVTFE